MRDFNSRLLFAVVSSLLLVIFFFFGCLFSFSVFFFFVILQGAGLDLVGAGLGRLSGSNHIASLYYLIVFMFSLFCAFLNIFFKTCSASLPICLSFLFCYVLLF